MLFNLYSSQFLLISFSSYTICTFISLCLIFLFLIFLSFFSLSAVGMYWVYFLSFFYSLPISVVSHLSYFENDYDQFWDWIIWKIVWWYSIGCSRQAITESLKIPATGCRERTWKHVQSNIFFEWKISLSRTIYFWVVRNMGNTISVRFVLFV